MRCKQGDLAIIEKSVDGHAVNKVVQCITIAGEHSQYGPIWLVSCEDEVVTEYGAVGNKGHIPDDWLRPIPPDQLDKNNQKKLELVE